MWTELSVFAFLVLRRRARKQEKSLNELEEMRGELLSMYAGLGSGWTDRVIRRQLRARLNAFEMLILDVTIEELREKSDGTFSVKIS